MRLKNVRFFLTFFCIKMVFLFLLLGTQVSIAQDLDFEIPDSLKNLEYDRLYKTYRKTFRDTATSKIYLQTCIKKAIAKGDAIKIAKAYCMLSYYIEDESKKIKMLNHSIELSKDLGDRTYPIMAYSFKGGYYLRKSKYSLALDSYLKLLSVAEKVQNIEFIAITKHNIACIKTEIGKYKEALPLFKENFSHIVTKHNSDTTRYLNSIIPLAESYRHNQLLDSASVYNFKGIQRSQNTKRYYEKFLGRILINEGINLFYKQQYKSASDSIVKGISTLNKNSSEHKKAYVLGAFYLGKLRLLQQDVISAKRHFLIMDSILQKEKITPLEIREGYEFLINSFKVNNKKEKQLEYINKLLKFDSILNKEASFVSSRLFKEFDTPVLLKEKETLINELKGNNKNLNLLVVFFAVLFSITIIFLYRQYHKRKNYQQKFEQLFDKHKPIEIIREKQPNDIGVADNIVEEILSNLTLFEQNKLFLKKNISTTSLAKDIKTNTKYLSKVINHHKHKNFANYINDLRIEYAITQLKKNKALKNYTIQAIAEEMGFNTAESFSSAFKKSTGIKTSYFIKKLHTIDTV